MLQAFTEGFILALGLILPLGAQNIFIFNQGAEQPSFLRAIPAVLTASICDSLLILCAVLSISMIVFTLPWLKISIYLIGIIFLIYMSVITWRNRSSKAILNHQKKPISAKKQIVLTMSASLLNPHALMDSIGVIGAHASQFSGRDQWMYTVACVLVSFCWFFGLSMAGRWLKKRDKTGTLILFANQLSAMLMFSMAVYLVWQVIIK